MVNRRIKENIKLGDLFKVDCYDKEGNLKWSDTIKNLVVNEGLDDSLDKYLKGSTYTAAHYALLTAATPIVAAGDTMSSHAGWTELLAYSEIVRQTVTWGAVSSQSVSNTANKASYSINSDSTTIGGACICTDDTKDGSSGTLYGGGAFTGGNKSLDDGDTLNVTVTASASAS